MSFRKMLKKSIPGASKVQLDKMIEWVRKEEEIIERGVMNYTGYSLELSGLKMFKMPKYLNSRPKGNKNITFRQIKDYLHIFSGLDKDNDLMLTFEDFK
jgi:hypothetical protein